MAKRVGRDVPTLSQIQALNPIILTGETVYVYNELENRTEHWRGLDGVLINGQPVGTQFNSLPAFCRISPPPDAPQVFQGQVYVEDEGEYALSSTTKIYVGESDPGPDGLDIMQENDIWVQLQSIAPPTNLTGQSVGASTVRLNWTTVEADETGTLVERSQSYLDWDTDIASGDDINLNDRVFYQGVLYVCTLGYTVPNPKIFDSQNFTVSAIAFTTITEVGADIQTYDVLDNAFDSRYLFRVSTKKGELYSSNNPTVSVKTQANVTLQTDLILALPGLWAFHKMYEASGALADASGNNRTMTLNGAATYQQTAIETSDGVTAKSILVQQGGNSGFFRNEIWNFSTASWEMGLLIKVPSQFGVPGGAPFMGIYNSAQPDGKVRLWTDNTGTKITLQLYGDNASWESATSTFTFQKGVTYFLTLGYDHQLARLYCFINNQEIVTFNKNLSTNFSCNSFGWAFDGGANLNLYMQKGFIKAGAMLTSEERAAILNSGTYQ